MAKPALRFIGNFWTMWDYPAPGKEWSLEQRMRAIKDAGFVGVTAQADAEVRRLAEQLGLRVIGYFSTGNQSEFRNLLESQKAAGAKHVNVQLADEDTLTPEATGLAIRLNEEARAVGIAASIEVHRDTCTETPEKT